MTLADRSLDIAPLPALVFGVGAVERLGEVVKRYGSRALVVTDPGVAGAGVAAQVVDVLRDAGVPTALFADVHANPILEDVLAAHAVLAAQGPADDTVVVGLGGGSAMDTAKAVALLATNPGGLDLAAVRMLDYRNVLPNPALPLVCVPTTSGTGAETNGFGVLTDHELNNKLYPGNDSCLPRVAVLDPALTVGVPKVATANTGMDALTHAVEAMSSKYHHEYADGLCLQVAHLVRAWLPAAVRDGTNLEARAQMQMASHLAGVAMATGTGQGACHGIGHALSTRLGVAHGAGLAVMLPHIMRFNLPTCTPAYARLALALGAGRVGDSDDANAAAAIAAVEALSAEVGTAKRLADFGMTDALVDVIAADCMADVVTQSASREPSLDDVRSLVSAAL